MTHEAKGFDVGLPRRLVGIALGISHDEAAAGDRQQVEAI